jgi:hypothetical protein
MICLLVDVTHKEHNDEIASFAVLKSNLSLYYYVEYTDNVKQNFRGKTTKAYTVLYGLEWSASVLVLCSHSFQEMLPLQ